LEVEVVQLLSVGELEDLLEGVVGGSMAADNENEGHLEKTLQFDTLGGQQLLGFLLVVEELEELCRALGVDRFVIGL
jgi:hypothetical protein